jgi:hypothetical protein
MITIILTSTVYVNLKKCCLVQKDVNARIETYLKSIKQWLQKTNFHIILVENSGYTFPELENEKNEYKERFEIVTLNASDEPKYLRNNDSKGASEMYSIHYAFKNSIMVHLSTFIIKITARYFIPDLENYLSQYDLDTYDSLTQNNRDRCEMVGCHYTKFSTIFNIYLFDIKGYKGHIEDVWKLRTSNCEKVLVCDPLLIEPTYRGGENEVYTII